MQRIAVIDYGMGNLRSVAKAVETACNNVDVLVTADASDIASADRVVCPGQGAARDCMRALEESALIPVVRQCVQEKPFLGICMGLQVLLSRSDENDGVACIDLVPGEVKQFADPLISSNGQRLKVPHMGWSQVEQTLSHPLWEGIQDQTRFYFMHSYFAVPIDRQVVAARCDYGGSIAVAVAQGNIFACQFHPEKSAQAGLQLLRNFSQWTATSGSI